MRPQGVLQSFALHSNIIYKTVKSRWIEGLVYQRLSSPYDKLCYLGIFMLIAKVVGSAVATIKDEKLNGTKLLVVRETNARGEPIGKPLVAIDTVDAGGGDLVLIASGSSARQTNITKDRPVDAVIMAILDSLEVDGEITFRKS